MSELFSWPFPEKSLFEATRVMNFPRKTNHERMSWTSNAKKGKGRRYQLGKSPMGLRSDQSRKKIAHWKRVILLDFPNNCLIYWYYGLVEFFTEMFNLAVQFNQILSFHLSLICYFVMISNGFLNCQSFWGARVWCTSLHFFVFNLEKPENPMIHYLIYQMFP